MARLADLFRGFVAGLYAAATLWLAVMIGAHAPRRRASGVMIEEVAARIPASLDAYRGGIAAGPGGPEAMPLSALRDESTFEATLAPFAAAYGDADRRAVVSFWSQYYFALLATPALTALMRLGRPLPLAFEATRLELDAEGRPARLLVETEGRSPSGEGLGGLIEGHLRPFVEMCHAAAAWRPRVLWGNAATILDYVAREIGEGCSPACDEVAPASDGIARPAAVGVPSRRPCARMRRAVGGAPVVSAIASPASRHAGAALSPGKPDEALSRFMLKAFPRLLPPLPGAVPAGFRLRGSVRAARTRLPVAVKGFIDTLLPRQDWGLILLAAAGLALVYVANAGLMVVVTYWGHVLGINIETTMRARAFDHLQKLSFNFYDRQKTGHLVARVTKDLEEIGEVAHHGPEDLFIAIMTLLGAFALMLWVHPPLALITGAILP